MEKKRKSDWMLALKILGNLAIATLIGIMVMFVAMPILDNNFGLVLVQIVILLIFIGLVYTPLWYEGDRDRNLEQFGHIQRDPLRGLRTGLWLMLPFGVSNLLLILARLGAFSYRSFWAVYKIINTYIWPLANLLTHRALIMDPLDVILLNGLPTVPETEQIKKLTESMAAFRDTTVATSLPWSAIIVCACCMLIFPLVAAVAYQLGNHRISLSHRLVYNKDGSKKTGSR